jgi:hypothetical protein
MAHRQFQDETGRKWEAWDVNPSTVQVRVFAESVRQSPFPLPPALRAGWLAFQCSDESRRLAPIPADWERLTDLELVQLASAANRIARRISDTR